MNRSAGGNISVYRHVIPGLYLSMTLNHSGGLLLRWFRDTLCKDKLLEARQSGKDAYDLMLADAKPGADRSVGPVAFLWLRHADAWYHFERRLSRHDLRHDPGQHTKSNP